MNPSATVKSTDPFEAEHSKEASIGGMILSNIDFLRATTCSEGCLNISENWLTLRSCDRVVSQNGPYIIPDESVNKTP